MCKLGKLRVETWAQQKASFLQRFFKFFQIDLGEEFTGPKLFQNEAYSAYASSLEALRVYSIFIQTKATVPQKRISFNHFQNLI